MTKDEYLRSLSDYEFAAYVEQWMIAHYEVPLNYEPYSGQSIVDPWTTPRSANDICEDAFGDYDRDEALEIAIDDLNTCSDVWVEKSISPSLMYLMQIDPKDVFTESINNVKKVMEKTIADCEIVYPMLYVQVISIMEQFLGSFFEKKIV